MDNTRDTGTPETTPLQTVQALHEQVRTFVERERICQVTAINAISRTTYPVPYKGDPSPRILAQAEISFRVEVVPIADFPGFEGYLTVEVVSTIDGRQNSFLIV